MIFFDDPQDEANFWARTKSRALFEIKRREHELENLKHSLGYTQADLDKLEKEGVIPDFDQEIYLETFRGERAYGKLFEEFSYVRYLHRLKLWRDDDEITYPKLRHHFWWVMHNCIAHIAIGLFPCRASFKLHDWTSKRLNQPWRDDSYHDLNNAPSDDEIVETAEKAHWKADI